MKTINQAQNSVNRLTETRVYDNLNRLRSITNLSSAASDAVAKSFTYTYNNANQRTSVNREDNTRWEYGYDALGHVTSAVKKLPDNAPLAGHQFGYSYDALGNRIAATFGGDSAGTGGLQTVSYTPNPTGDRNQYSSITHPGVVLTTGKANAAAAVTINQQTAQDRQGEYFSHQIAVPNELGPQLIEITTEADDGTDLDSETRKEQVPPRDGTRVFDADGNLTFDGYRDWVWDAENRLISVETRETLVPLGAIPHRVEYAYDYLGRRIQRRASQKFGNRWEIVNETRYLYDGWNVIAELDGNSTTPTLIQSYLWGLDLSGTAQGAGGVGGLLAVQRHVGAKAGVHLVSYDGNGNVVALADAADGTLSASYEYDAFGNLLEKSGVFAAANPYRFSTKPQDEVTGLYYYGYRYYDPGNGRWLNRDPIEENGGVNLYGFVQNNPNQNVDVLGNSILLIVGGIWLALQEDNGWSMGRDYALGTGQTNRFYKDGSKPVEDLKRSAVVKKRRKIMALRASNLCSNKEVKSLIEPLGSELGLFSEGEYAKLFWFDELWKNSTAAALGSFSEGEVEILSVDCKKCSAKIRWNGVNRMGAASNTRFPPILGGYHDGTSIQALLSSGVSLQSVLPLVFMHPEVAGNFLPSSVLANNPLGLDKPLRTITFNFEWEEEIFFDKVK